MMRAIGIVIVLYAIAHLMSGAFSAFEHALESTFETVEVAAVISKLYMLDAAN